MKYIAKLPKGNVNVTQNNFFIEGGKLFIGLILSLGVAYIVLITVISLLIDNLSIENEKKIQTFFSKKISKNTTLDSREKRIKSIVEDLSICANLSYDIDILVLNSSKVNAMAVIGGTIMVTKGLLDTIKDDRELTFVLGHEMGHFKYRHHLKGISSAVVLTLLSWIIQSDTSSIINQILVVGSMQYSQKQEINADKFGVDMLMCRYNSTDGATGLFKRMSKDDSWSDFMQTHPNFATRVDKIERYIEGLK